MFTEAPKELPDRNIHLIVIEMASMTVKHILKVNTHHNKQKATRTEETMTNKNNIVILMASMTVKHILKVNTMTMTTETNTINKRQKQQEQKKMTRKNNIVRPL